ncbi:hypothetical protein NP493_162g07030 [Ridgeia piscesae]|uniref:Zinc finger protein 277 n=1 Tax=Ridgeia piscesae TaxID=27915 RepID=A0AAD9UFI5_RIDPI|nr:hypothetical protein NP493_162g07030 [Ridgeia piscesae]
MQGGHSEVTSGEVTKEKVGCLLCAQQFDVMEMQDDLLRHLLLQHKLVIADVKLVAHFKKYLDYWRQRFKDAAITEFCSVIKTNTKETDVEPEESYYLLCDALPEDKNLRVRLQQEKLHFDGSSVYVRILAAAPKKTLQFTMSLL